MFFVYQIEFSNGNLLRPERSVLIMNLIAFLVINNNNLYKR